MAENTGNPVTNETAAQVDAEKIVSQTPLDASRDNQTVATEEQSKGFGYLDGLSKGLKDEQMGNSSFTKSFYLEDEEAAKPFFASMGVDEEDYAEVYASFKSKYDTMKSGVYSSNGIYGGDGSIRNRSEQLYGPSSLNRTESEMYIRYFDPKKAPMKIANPEDYVDVTNFKKWDSESGEFVDSEMTAFENSWNPDLIVDQDKDKYGRLTGMPYYRELKPGESHYGKDMASMYKYTPIYGNSGPIATSMNFFNQLYFGSKRLVGQFGVMGITIDEYIGDKIFPKDSFGEALWDAEGGAFGEGKDFWNDMIKMSDRAHYSPSEEIERLGFTGSAGSAIYHISGALGEFTPQLMAAYASGGSSVGMTTLSNTGKTMAQQILKKGVMNVTEREIVTKSLRYAAKKTAGKVLTDVEKGIVSQSDKILAKYATGVSADMLTRSAVSRSLRAGVMRKANQYMVIGAGQAVGGNFGQMKQNGISDEVATAVSMALAPILYGTEKIVGTGWLMSKYGYTAMKVNANKLIQEIDSKILEKVSQEATKKVVDIAAQKGASKFKSIAGLKNINRLFTKEYLTALSKETGVKAKILKENIGRTFDGNAAGGYTLFGKNAARGLNKIDEWEMAFDAARINKGTTRLTGFLQGRGNPFTYAKGALREGGQEALEQVGYMAGFWGHDNFIAEEGAVKGKGAMGYYSFRDDVLSRASYKELRDNFLGGFYVGGLAAGFMKNRGSHYHNAPLFDAAAQAGETDKAAEYFASLREQDPGFVGSTEMNPELQVLNKNGKDRVWAKVDKDYEVAGLKEGTEIKSEADFNYYNMIRELYDAKALYERTGLGQGALTKFRDNNSIFFRGMGVFRDLEKQKASLSQLNAELESKEISETEREKKTQEKVKLEESLKETRDQYNYLMADDGTGHSKGYKDSMKNAAATMMLANDAAAEKSNLKEKYGDKVPTKFTEKEVIGFINARSEFVAETQDLNLYGEVKYVHSSLEDWAQKKIVADRKKIASFEQAIEESTRNELTDITNEVSSIIESVKANTSVSNRAVNFVKLNEAVKKMEALSETGANSEIQSIFGNFEKQAKAAFADIQSDPMDQFSSDKVFIPQYDKDGNLDGYTKESEGLKEGDERFSASISEQELHQSMLNNPVMNNAFHKVNNIHAEYNKVKANASKFGYDTNITDEAALANAAKGMVDEVYLNPLEDILARVKAGEETEWRNEDIEALLSTIDNVLKQTESIERSLKVRGHMIYQMDLDDEFKPLLDEEDKPLDPTIADAMIENVRAQADILRGYEKAMKEKIGHRDIYFVKTRHEEAMLNILALKTIFDNKDVLKIFPAELEKRFKAIDLFPTKEKAYNDDEVSKIAIAEKEIFAIYDEISKVSKSLNNKNLLKDLLEHSFLQKDVYEGDKKESGRFYNYSLPYEDRRKSKIVAKLTDAITDVAYGEYNNTTRDRANNIAYHHFVNTLVALGSGVKISDLASLRLSFYNTEPIVSSTEQIKAENEILTFLHGGSEIFDKIVSIEKDLFKQASDDNDKKALYEDLYQSRIAFLAGDVQTGKSVQMIPQIIKMANKLGKYERYVLVAHSRSTIANFNKLVSQLVGAGLVESGQVVVLSKNDYVKGNFNTDYTTNALTFVDEATLLTNSELSTIENSYLTKDDISSIVYVGDSSQMVPFIGPNAQARTKVMRHGFRSTPTNKKFATDNPMLANVMDIAKENNSSVYDAQYPKYWSEISDGYEYTNNEGEKVIIPKGRLQGTQYFTNVQQIVDAGIERIKTGDVSKNELSIVFLTEEHYDDYVKNNAEHKNFLEENKSFVSVLMNDPSVPVDANKFDSIQGDRRNEVFIAYDGSLDIVKAYASKGLPGMTLLPSLAMYTLIGRAKDYVGFIGDENNKYYKRPDNFRIAGESLEGNKNKDLIIDYLSDTMNGKGVPLQKESSIKDVDLGKAGITTDEQKVGIQKLESLSEESKSLKTEGKYYIDENTGQKYKRVTNNIGPKNVKPNIISTFNENLNKDKSSQANYGAEKASAIGTAYDDIFRYVLNYSYDMINANGEVKMQELWDLFGRTKYPDGRKNSLLFPTDEKTIPESFINYINNLSELKAKLLSKGEIPYTSRVILYTKYGEYAGSPDLITVDAKGKYRVYDLKTKRDKNMYYLNHPSKYVYSEDIKKGRNELDKYSQQVSTYTYMLGIQEGMKSTDIAADNKLGIFVQSVTYGDDASAGIKESLELKEHMVDKVETNIISEIEKARNKNPDREELDYHKTSNGYEFIVGEEYEDKSGNRVIIDKLAKYGRGIKIFYTGNPEGIFSTHFMKQYSPISTDPVITLEPEEAEIITSNDNKIVEDKIAARSANIYKKTGAVYSNSVTMPIEQSSLVSMGIDVNPENIELIKAIKASIAKNAVGKLQFRDQFIYINDSGAEVQAKNGIFVMGEYDPVGLTSLLKKQARSPKMFNMFTKLVNDPRGLDLLNHLSVIGLPRAFVNGKWTTVDDYVENSSQYIKDLKDQYGKGDVIHNDLVEYNITLFTLFATGNENNLFDGTVIKQSPHNINGTLKKTSSTVPLSQLRSRVEVKGISIGTKYTDISFYDVHDKVTGANTQIMTLPYSSSTIANSETDPRILLLTPTVEQSKKTAYGGSIKSIIEDEINRMKAGQNLSVYSSTIHSFIATNKSIFFNDDFSNNPVSKGSTISFNNLIFQHKGKIKFHENYIQKRSDYEIEDRKSMIMIGEFLLEALNGNPYLSNIFSKARLPLNKNYSNIADLYTNVEDIYHAPTFFNVDEVLNNMLNEPEEADTNFDGLDLDDQNPFLSINDNSSFYTPISKKKAKGIVATILGSKYSKEWVGFTKKETYNEVSVFGYMMSGKIKLVNKGNNVNRHTIRHEIFHVVDEYFLGEDTQEKIYDIIRTNVKGYENATDAKVKEFLADWYGTFGHLYTNLENIDEAYLSRYKSLLDNIKDRYLLFSGELAQLFGDIESGKYKDDAIALMGTDIKENLALMSRVNNKKFRHKNKLLEKMLKESGFESGKVLADKIKKLKDQYNEMSEDEHVTAAYDALEQVFGDDFAIEESSENFLIDFTLGTSIYGSNLTFEESIRNMTVPHTEHSGLEKLSTNIKNAKLEINGKKVNIANATAADYPYMSNADKRRYVKYHTETNFRVAQGFVKLNFPSYVIKDGGLGRKKTFGFGDRSRAVEEANSDKMNWMLGTILITTENGKTVKRKTPTGTQDMLVDKTYRAFLKKNEVATILKEASNKAMVNIMEKGLDSSSFMESLKQELINMMPNMESNSKIKVYSIYKRLFDGYTTTELGRDIQSMTNMATINDSNGKDVRNSLAAIMTQYSNATLIQPVRYHMDFDYSKVTTLNPSTKSANKQTIEDGLTASLYASGRLRGDVKKTFNRKSNMNVRDGEERVDLLRFENGDLYLSDQPILVKTKNSTYEFANESRMISQALKMSNYVGLNSLNSKLIDRLLAYRGIPLKSLNLFDTKKIKGSSVMGPDEFLATVFGNFSELIMMNIEMENTIDEISDRYDTENKGIDWTKNKTIHASYISDIKDGISKIKTSPELKAFMKAVNYDTSKIDGIVESMNFGEGTIATINDIKFINPASFFAYIEALGDMLFHQQGSYVFSNYYLADKKVYAYENNNVYNSTFPTVYRAGDYNTMGYIPKVYEKNLEGKLVRSGVPDAIALMKDGTSRSLLVGDKNIEYDKDGNISNITDDANGNNAELTVIGIKNNFGIETDYATTNDIGAIDRARTYADLYFDYLLRDNSSTNLLLPLGYSSREDYVHMKFDDPHGLKLINISVDDRNKINDFSFDKKALFSSIGKTFEYYKAHAENSYNRWSDFVANNPSFSSMYQGRLVDVLGDGYSTDDSIFDDVNEEGGIVLDTEEEMNELLNSGLYLGADYTYEKVGEGYVVKFGNLIRMNIEKNTSYTRENFNKLSDQGMSESIIDEIFSDELAKNNKEMKEYFISDVYGVGEWFSKEAESKGYTKGSSKLVRYNEANEPYYNPIFQSLYYTNAVLMPSILSAIAGPEGQYIDVINYSKRFNVNKTPKSNLRLNIKGGIGTKMKVHFYIDEDVSLKDYVSSHINESFSESTVEKYDGGSLGSIAAKIMIRNTYGNEDSPYEDTIIKPLYTGVDASTGLKTIMKLSTDFVSNDMIESHPTVKKMQLKLLDLWSRDVKSKYIVDLRANFNNYYKGENGSLDFESAMAQVIDDIENPKSSLYVAAGISDPVAISGMIDLIKSEVYYGKVPHTSVKVGVRNLSREDDSIENITGAYINSEDYGIISNYGSDSSSTATSAIANQMIAHIGVKNPEIGNSISTSLSAILRNDISKLYIEEIGISPNSSSWGPNEIEKASSYMRKMGEKAASTNKENLSLAVGLKEGISLQPVQIARQLEAFWTSKLNTSIKPRTHGTRMIQASGSIIDIYSNSDGDTYGYKTLLKFGYADENGMITSAGVEKGFARRDLKPMHHDSNGVFHPGEVAATYIYASTFGIKEGEQVEDGYVVYNKNGEAIDFVSVMREMSDETVEDKKKMLYDYLTTNFIGESLHYSKEGSSPFMRISQQAKLKAIENTLIVDKYVAQELAEYLVNYDSSLDVIDARVPFDTPALGFVGRIKQFVWGNGSVIYISPLENIRTGGDFDIDELSVYHKHFYDAFTAPDLDVEDEHSDWHMNNIVDQMFTYYRNVDNADMSYNKTSTDEIKKAVNDVKTNIRYQSLASTIKLKEMTIEGDSAIGTFALASSSAAYLNQLEETFDIDKTLTMMGFLQAALDNGQDPILARFGLPREMMDIFVGYSANGLTYPEIIDNLKAWSVKDVINKVIKGKPILKKRENFVNILGEVKSDYQDKFKFSVNTLTPLLLEYEDSYEYEINELLSDLVSEDSEIRNEARTILAKIRYQIIKAAAKIKKEDEVDTEQNDDVIPEEPALDVIDEGTVANSFVRAIDNLSWHYTNTTAINSLEEAFISANVLFKLGKIVSLRNGIPSDHNDKLILKKNLEASLYSKLDDYLKGKMPNEKSAIKYFMATDNDYRVADENQKAYMLNIQRRIIEKGFIPELISSNPYFNILLDTFMVDQGTMSSVFMINDERLSSYRNAIAEKQNRNSFDYKSQYKVVDRIISELIIGEYLNRTDYVMNVSVPKEGSKGFSSGPSSLMNMPMKEIPSSLKYAENFPVLMRDIQRALKTYDETMSIKYFSALGIKLERKDVNNLRNNNMIYSIRIKNDSGFEKIEIDPSVVYDQLTTQKMKNDFRKLPEDLQIMFEVYNAINSKLRYTTRGMSSVITNRLKVDMNRVLTPEVRMEILDEFFSENFEQHIEYALMDKAIRRAYDKNDVATAITKSIRRGAKRINIAQISTGVVNKNTRKPIYTEMNARYYKGHITNAESKLILKGIPSIKLGNVKYAELDAIDEAIKNGNNVVKHVEIRTMIEHGYTNGIYKTEFGELVNVEDNGVTSILVKRVGAEFTIEKAENRGVVIAPDAKSFLNMADTQKDIIIDHGASYRFYFDDKGFDNSKFSFLKNVGENNISEFLLHRDKANYNLDVSYLGKINNEEFSSEYVSQFKDVKSINFVTGIDFYLHNPKTKSIANRISKFLKGVQVGNGTNAVHVVKIVNRGEMINENSVKAEKAIRLNNDIDC